MPIHSMILVLGGYSGYKVLLSLFYFTHWFYSSILLRHHACLWSPSCRL